MNAQNDCDDNQCQSVRGGREHGCWTVKHNTRPRAANLWAAQRPARIVAVNRYRNSVLRFVNATRPETQLGQLAVIGTPPRGTASWCEYILILYMRVLCHDYVYPVPPDPG